VLAIGVAGHRSLEVGSPAAARLARDSSRLFADLLMECTRIVAAAPDLFAGAPPRLRVVTRLMDGSDLVICSAAREAGAEIRAVLPYRPSAGAAGFRGSTAGGLFDTLLAAAEDPFDLGGEPGSQASGERAGHSLLDRSDILVAFWDGQPDGDRAGIAALVQDAVERRMPVLLLPLDEGGQVAVIDDPDELLLSAVAVDLPRVAFANNRDRVLARAFAPPASAYERRALKDSIGERRGRTSRRYEYRFLLKLAERVRSREPAPSNDEEWSRAGAVAGLVSAKASAAVARIETLQARMDDLAGFYRQRARSGIVLRYGLSALGSLLVAVFTLLTPQFGLAWLAVQAVITAVTIGEETYASRRRWNERWLDYRSLAERLRCDRFLMPIGIATVQLDAQTSAEHPAWMRWCHGRLQRATWMGGKITPSVVEAAMAHLVAIEIASQIRYHEAATLRFRSLGRRLRALGFGAIACTLGASLLLIASNGGGHAQPLALQSLLMVALITLPSVFLASRGLRAESRFDLAAARSQQSLAALMELGRRIATGPASFDRLIQASRAAAAAMILDTVDWRIGVQLSRSPYRPNSTDASGR